VAWTETTSPHLVVRHDEGLEAEVARVVDLLEATRESLADLLPAVPGETLVVLHPRTAQLVLAQPALPALHLATAPAARRYLVGWVARGRLDVLAGAALHDRASGGEGSRDLLRLSPATLYAQLALAASAPQWPPPFRPAAAARASRWAWLWLGAGPWLSGQLAFARPAIGRRLREGPRPAFPPAARDASLLGATVLDLLERHSGARAVVGLATRPLAAGGPAAALSEAFGGVPPAELEHAWRTHLDRLGGRG